MAAGDRLLRLALAVDRGGGAMVYFGIHGPFRPGLEDRIGGEVKRLLGVKQ